MSWGKFCAGPSTIETRPGSGRDHKLPDVCHLLAVSVEKALAPVTLARFQLT